MPAVMWSLTWQRNNSPERCRPTHPDWSKAAGTVRTYWGTYLGDTLAPYWGYVFDPSSQDVGG
jgi:hypothetical protein